jgi:endonuclease/exonuclease/phosphatase family metal-dependent hydrolase
MAMKNIKIIFIFLFCFFNYGFSQEFNVISINVRYDNPADGVNKWDYRKNSMVKLLRKYHPSIIGIQEGLSNQVKFLQDSLAGYKYIGVGRDDGIDKGEFSAVFYNANEIEFISGSTFWLSEQPDRVSTGWDAALNRICTYGLFRYKSSGKRFWVFNTHFDHQGKIARQKSAELILTKIEELNGENLPVILLGDFNDGPDSKPIQLVREKMDDAMLKSRQEFSGPYGTFNGFDVNSKLTEKCDYIFVKNLNVLSYSHINEKRPENLCITDHLPVFAKILFR